MTREHREEFKDVMRNLKLHPTKDSLICEWKRLCQTKAVSKAHQWLAHRERRQLFFVAANVLSDDDDDNDYGDSD